jgi:hypothetical protein
LLSCSLEGSSCEFSLGVLLLSCSTGVLFSGVFVCSVSVCDQASGGKPKEQSSTAKTKNGGVVIYKVGTDNIITEATNRLSTRLPLVVDLVFRCCLARLKVHLVNFHWAFYCCLAQPGFSFQGYSFAQFP